MITPIRFPRYVKLAITFLGIGLGLLVDTLEASHFLAEARKKNDFELHIIHSDRTLDSFDNQQVDILYDDSSTSLKRVNSNHELSEVIPNPEKKSVIPCRDKSPPINDVQSVELVGVVQSNFDSVYKEIDNLLKGRRIKKVLALNKFADLIFVHQFEVTSNIHRLESYYDQFRWLDKNKYQDILHPILRSHYKYYTNFGRDSKEYIAFLAKNQIILAVHNHIETCDLSPKTMYLSYFE